MEEVYVVKVKTRPEPSKLYPSERRYSAVTVGGLGLVHGLLAVTSLLLATLGIAAEGIAASYGAGIALGIAGCAAAVVGVLAWRRWYVDNNIRYFLVTSLVSGCAALICIILTAVAIATMQEELTLHHLSLRYRAPLALPLPTPLAQGDIAYDEDYDDFQANDTDLIHKFIQEFENRKNRSTYQNTLSNETYRLKLDDYHQDVDQDIRTVSSLYENTDQSPELPDTETDKDDPSPSLNNDEQGHSNILQGPFDDGLPFLHYNDGRYFHEHATNDVRNVLSINILIASFLELAWSLLSVRIAWRGMTNDYPDDDGNTRVVVGSETTKATTDTSYLPKFMKRVKTKDRDSSTVRRPDLLSNHHLQRHNLTKKLQVSVVSEELDQYLPQEESTTEYQERVRRFLASNSDSMS